MSRGRRRLVPYFLLGPGLLWLFVFFAIPMAFMGYISLNSGSIEDGFSFTSEWANFGAAFGDYGSQFGRSFLFAGIATLFALLIAYPLAYTMAFHGGKWKNALLLIVIAPFFTTYLIRTLAWQTILADDSFVVDVAKAIGLVGADGRLLATSFAVIAGITYNFLPFMALPLYVSLEKIDRRLIEAATDLYASRWTAFRKVTLLLALPGIFAGSLLTFIPAAGDFINAQLLGTSRQYMIGNVIQSKFLVITDYPVAAAMSFILMAVLVTVVVLYTRALGTRTLTEAAA